MFKGILLTQQRHRLATSSRHETGVSAGCLLLEGMTLEQNDQQKDAKQIKHSRGQQWDSSYLPCAPLPGRLLSRPGHRCQTSLVLIRQNMSTSNHGCEREWGERMRL